MEISRERTKHTPTPWEIDANDERHRDIYGPYRGRQQLIVTAYREGRGRDTIDDGAEAEANAAFIVRAVNAHDELVAALKQMQIAMKNFLTLEGGIEKSAMEAADKALAMAEGR